MTECEIQIMRFFFASLALEFFQWCFDSIRNYVPISSSIFRTRTYHFFSTCLFDDPCSSWLYCPISFFLQLPCWCESAVIFSHDPYHHPHQLRTVRKAPTAPSAMMAQHGPHQMGSTISRAGGTPGWLWNLRPRSLDWISHPDKSTGPQLAQPITGSPGGTCHGLKLREYGLNVP